MQWQNIDIFFTKYCYCISKPMLIHVHVKIIDSILLVSNIWYCGLNNDMGQEKLNWPKLLWYVIIIVGQVIGVTCVVSECNLCIIHMRFPRASNLPLIESTVPPYIRKYRKKKFECKRSATWRHQTHKSVHLTLVDLKLSLKTVFVVEH